jgi:hypothetical protein
LYRSFLHLQYIKLNLKKKKIDIDIANSGLEDFLFPLEFRGGSWKVCIGGDIDDKYEG